MTRWLQSATNTLFILTEALAWFIVLRVLVSLVDHSAAVELLADIESGGGGLTDDPRVVAAAEVLRGAINRTESGPTLLLMVIGAFSAVWLARGVTQLRLSVAWTVGLTLLASVVAVNVLLHVTLANDLLFWDAGGVASFIDDPETALASQRDPVAFVTDQDMSQVRGGSLAIVIFGLFALWARFLYVGQGTVDFERALRSFTVSFPLVMIATLLSQISGTVAGLFALPYFVIAVFTLAVANGARASEQYAPLTRSAPWALSALVTLGLLSVVALLFGLLAVLEVERAIVPIGEVALQLIGWLLVLVMTPLFWVMEQLFARLFSGFGDGIQNVSEGVSELGPDERSEQEQGSLMPTWFVNPLRIAVGTLLVFAFYRLVSYLLRRKDELDEEDEYAEQRSATGGSGGVNQLLRDLLPGRRRRSGVPAWLDRHAVYRLFARAVNDAEDRGFPRRAGETPLEFAAVAERALDAAPFPGIAAEFDRARYGRHYPSEEELSPLDRALEEWERGLPATDELREQVARDPSDEEQRPPTPPVPDKPEPPPGAGTPDIF